MGRGAPYTHRVMGIERLLLGWLAVQGTAEKVGHRGASSGLRGQHGCFVGDTFYTAE